MNHVFVDFENVHEVDLNLIGAKAVSFTLMVGPKQTKLNTDLVERLMEHSACVQLVRLKTPGKNALDFALADYLGRAVLADPSAYFHLIARDTGYDPLIEHLRERHINVRRYPSCAELTFNRPGKTTPTSEPAAMKIVAKKATKKAVAKKGTKKAVGKKVSSVEEGTERVVKNFRDHPKARPVKRKTLLTKVGDLIGEAPGGDQVLAVIERMTEAGYLTFNEKDVPKYNL
ncbi:MAG: PIN domain-containing protein [Verrucomicrobiales bacterium]|jgi:hypothetical protein|nr:PIN domain-containing protein [Verrucomicrobiales bacterium]